MPYNKKAFTLVELMVSVGIIIVVVLSAMGIYIKVIGTRQKSVGQLNIQEEGQYLMSLIVKDVRAGMVDYSAYDGNYCGVLGAGGVTEQLCLLDFSDTQNQISYKREVNAIRGYLEKCKGVVAGDDYCDDNDNYDSITMEDVSIERLDFYIMPTSNPFTPGSEEYNNPKVTVVLKLKSLIEKIGEKELVLQQTIPQRHNYRK